MPVRDLLKVMFQSFFVIVTGVTLVGLLFLSSYHKSESVEIVHFSAGFPTFRIYGTGGQKSVDLC